MTQNQGWLDFTDLRSFALGGFGGHFSCSLFLEHCSVRCWFLRMEAGACTNFNHRAPDLWSLDQLYPHSVSKIRIFEHEMKESFDKLPTPPPTPFN